MESKLPRCNPDKKAISTAGNDLESALVFILNVLVLNTYKAVSNRIKNALKPGGSRC